MNFFADNIFLILFLPLWIGLIILSGAFFKLTENRKTTVILTVLSSFTGLVFSLALFNNIKISPVIENTFLWLTTGNFNIFLGTYIDSVSVVFLSILMLISLIVQIYSFSYMEDKKDFNRYFIYLNFFNFAMAGLVLSPNLIQLYIFWELVGIASYLLIGFFHNKEDVSQSAKKVFIINRIGDTALLCGIIILAYFSVTYMNQEPDKFLSFNDINYLFNSLQGLTSPVLYNLICLLFLIGAFVKSAQFPFQQWLIDAMKAPTPVSALIHSATMVCAGIFLIIRIYPLLNNELLNIILFTGLLTAIISAFIAISQKNIKKMLAYSTSSQLGLMFCAIGLKLIPAAIIYLVIHSFTKALLFLCTGTISKISGTIEMNEVSGLRKTNFYLALFWIIAALSLAGMFFGGFTSKEMLLNLVKTTGNSSILFLILLTSFMSTFYIFKAYFYIFEGENSRQLNLKSKSMYSSMMILCVFVIIPGFIFKLSNLNLLCLITELICITAVISAYFSHKCNKISLPSFICRLSEKELFMPVSYNFTGRLFLKLFNIVYLFDKYIIEGSIDITVKINKFLSDIISKLQNGNIQTYISYSIFGTGVILMIIMYFYFAALRS